LDAEKPKLESGDNPLGSIATVASPSEESAKKRDFQLQENAAALLPGNRVAKCLRTIAPGNHGVQVMHVEGEGRAYYRGLMTCNRVWECPVCAKKITSKKREEISEALSAARVLGWTPVMISYTLRHHLGDPLRGLLDGLLKSVRAFKSGEEYQNIKEEYGIVGGIRTLEVTYTENGWHPHCHEIIFLDLKSILGENFPYTPTILQGLEKWLKERWQAVVKNQGFDASYEHGIHVTEADADIAEYVAKFGHEPQEARWTASDELARSPAKRSDKKGATPFQLLERYGRGGDKQAAALFVEYVNVFANKNQLTWSRGLRAALGLDLEKADDEITEEVAEAVEAAFLLPSAWWEIVRTKQRGNLLAVLAAGGVPALRAWLAERGITHEDLTELDLPPPK